MTEAATSSS